MNPTGRDATDYAIRSGSVLQHGGLVSAKEMRERLRLGSHQALGLPFFDKDEVLERAWNSQVIHDVAAANYSFVVAPSDSAWSPRPRTEILVNAKRSLCYFAALQKASARAISRVVWEVELDVTVARPVELPEL
jgi:hypothetical protein